MTNAHAHSAVHIHTCTCTHFRRTTTLTHPYADTQVGTIYMQVLVDSRKTYTRSYIPSCTYRHRPRRTHVMRVSKSLEMALDKNTDADIIKIIINIKKTHISTHTEFRIHFVSGPTIKILKIFTSKCKRPHPRLMLYSLN